MATKTKNLNLLSSHQKARLRRQHIDQMMAEGTTVEGIYLSFSTRPELIALFTGTKAAKQVLKGDIARVQRERGDDTKATARADHVRGLKKTLAVAEALLTTMSGQATNSRYVLSEVNRLRSALALMEGVVGLNMARQVGRARAGAGQVAFGDELLDPERDAQPEPEPGRDDDNYDAETEMERSFAEPYYAADEDEPGAGE